MAISKTITVDGDYAGRDRRFGPAAPTEPVWRSTGLYAPAGKKIHVKIDAAAAGRGLDVLLGAHTDQVWDSDTWSRFPALSRSYPLDAPEIDAASAFGGLVYVRVPAGSELGPITVTIEGAVGAPLFQKGKTTADAWRNVERSQPGPWAEIATDRLSITVPSSAIAALDDPAAVLDLWDRILDADADLAAIPAGTPWTVRPSRTVPGDLYMNSRLAVALAFTSLAWIGCVAEEADKGDLDEAQAIDSQEEGVVYGSDSRRDVYKHTDATLRERAQLSTVALMSPDVIDTSDPDNVTFKSETLGKAEDLCSTERFRNDPTAAGCSGTLIDDDLVLTAGHCVESAEVCAGTRFVFNYYRPSEGVLQTVTTDDIFSCQSIVTRQEGTVGGQELDYAIIRLDRSAAPRFTPAPVRKGNTPLAKGSKVAVIGSGSGIPLKIDSGGSVRDARCA
ncbi:M60 family peptidase N-terminal accessory domain-containing protein [Sorangium sp. So ce1153]